MKLYYKAGTLLIIFTMLLMNVPVKTIVGNYETINSADASVLLTREDAKKFEGQLAAGFDSTSIIQSDGTVYSIGDNGSGQLNVSEWEDIVKIVPGFYHTVGLKNNGEVVATGHNPDGRTDVNEWKDIVDIAAGDGYTVGLKSDGSILAIGENATSRANFSTSEGIIAITAGTEHTIGLKEDGTVVSAGSDNFGQSNLANWKDITSVAAAGYHTVGLKKDGTVIGAGNNQFGQLDVSEWTDIVSISTSYTVTVGLKSNGTVVAAGFDMYAQKEVSTWKDVIAVVAGYKHVIGLKSDGTILTAGNSDFGQLDLSNWSDIKAISAGGLHSVGLRKDGTVVAAGSNVLGQLEVTGPDWSGIKAIAAGAEHTVGLKENGTVIATGSNSMGQLNVDDWNNIVAIAAGARYTAGLKSDGTVVASGYDFHGLISDVAYWTDIVALYGGEEHIFGIKRDGTVVASGTGQNGGQNNVGNWTNIVSVDTGSSHTVGLKQDGTLVFAGYDSYGIASTAKDWKDIKAISASGDIQIGLKNDGTVVASGNFQYGSRNISNWTNIIAISNGYHHVIGLKSDGTVVTTRNNPAESMSTGIVSIDGKIVKPTDTVNISLKNNGQFTIQSNEIKLLNGDSVIYEGPMEAKSDSDYALSYLVKPTDRGEVDVEFPNVHDLFGNSVKKQNAFQVIPLQSIVSSKAQAQSGNKITLTATFYQNVKPDFTISLSGGAELQASRMTEVEGSNGTKYTLEYTVPSNYTEGQVDATIKNVTTVDGHSFGSYTEKAVFHKANNPLPIQSLTATKALGKIGDKITITAVFSESVKPGIEITLAAENFTLPTATMTEVTGSNGKKYVYTHPVEVNINGPISAHITNANDENGSLYGEYHQNDLFVSDGMPPYVVGMEASASGGKLGDKVVITATFSEPIKPLVKLSFYNGAVLAPVLMKEVPGSNATKYSYEYTVDEMANGKVYAYLQDIEDLAGNKYTGMNRDGKYYNFNLFNPDGVKPKVANFVSDKKIYEAGDTASFTATFSEPVKPGVSIKLTGALNEEYKMTQVDDKTYEFHYVIPSDIYGDVNIELVNIEDIAGNTSQFLKPKGFFISNPSNANLASISVKSGTKEYALTPKFSSGIYEYHASVPSSVTNIDVGAVTEDLNTTVTGVGNNSVKTGNNVISLTSTSTDGTKKTYKVNVTVEKPVALPTNVKAASNSYNSVKLNWTAASGVTGYEVYRSSSSSGIFSKVATTTGNTYTNTGLNTGTTYYYKIRSYKTGAQTAYSSFSPVVSAKPVPAVPISAKAVSSSYNSIKTSWSAVSGASGYQVYRAPTGSGSYSLIGTTTSTSFNNGSLTTNKSYYYKIRAYRTVGSVKVYGNFSSVISAKPVPAIPTSVKAGSSSYNSIKTSWAAINGASGYQVYRATTKSGSYSIVGTTRSTSYNNIKLTTNKTYYYKIRAYRMVGSTKVYSAFSAIVNAKPVPSVPANWKASRVSSSQIKLTWNSVPGASGYQVYRSTTKSGTYSLLKSTTSLNYTNSGLTKGKTYYYKARAYRTVGKTKVYSGWTSIISARS